jgi:hypothetical protein
VADTTVDRRFDEEAGDKLIGIHSIVDWQPNPPDGGTFPNRDGQGSKRI